MPKITSAISPGRLGPPLDGVGAIGRWTNERAQTEHSAVTAGVAPGRSDGRRCERESEREREMARWRERGARWHECLIASAYQTYQTYLIGGGRGSTIGSLSLPSETDGHDWRRRQRRAALGCSRTSVKRPRPRDLPYWRRPLAVVRRCRTGVTGSEQRSAAPRAVVSSPPADYCKTLARRLAREATERRRSACSPLGTCGYRQQISHCAPACVLTRARLLACSCLAQESSCISCCCSRKKQKKQKNWILGPASLPLPDPTSSSSSPLLSPPLQVRALRVPAGDAGSLPITTDMSTSKSPVTTKQKRAPASRSSHGIETATGPPPALSTQRSHSNDVVLVRRAHHPADFAFAHQHFSTGARSNSVSSSNTSDTSSQHRARDDDARSASASVSTSNSSSLAPRRNRNRDSQETARPSRRRSLRQDDDNMHSRGPSRYGEDLLDHDRDRTLRALEGLHDDHIDNSQPDREESSSSIGDRSDGERAQGANDDLFLNLARATSSRQGNEEASARNERRRSRIALASHRQSLPLNSYSSPLTRSALKDAELSNQDSSPAMAPNSAEAWQPQHGRRTSHGMSPTIQHRSSVREKSYAASAHPLEDSGRRRYSGMGARSSFSTPRGAARGTSPESTVSHERRSSIKMPARLNGYRPSNLSYSAPRNYHSSPLIDRSPAQFDDQAVQEAPHKDGTESTASTTAPSTVWDELDDLKSRIRKLELTGKLPPSSGADISQASGDRPRTATTTVTTISSSPKHGRQNSISPSSSTLGGPGAANLHPLLHSALAKTKPLISQDIYRALEATASDALSIAALSNSGNGTLSASQSVINSPTSPSVPDRHLRRKADSMCRSLTELCIALSEAPSKTSAGSPTATPQASTVGPEPPIPNGIYNDAPYITTAPNNASNTAPSQIPRSSPSALNRLEARRSSMLALQSTPSPRTSSQTPTNASSTPPTYAPSSTPSHRLPRSSTLLSRRYGSRTYTPNPTASAAIDNDRDDVESTRSFRAPSRAATDVGYIRHSPREGRISREYTSSHPLPQMESPAAAAAAAAAASSSSTTTPSSALTLTNGISGLGRSPSVQSTSNTHSITPLRRHYGSASLSNMPSPASPGGLSLNGGTGLNSRRFLDRNSAPPPSNTSANANTPTQIIDRDAPTLPTSTTKAAEREARADLPSESGPVASFMDGLRRSRAGSLGRSGSRKLRQAVVDPLPPSHQQQKR